MKLRTTPRTRRTLITLVATVSLGIILAGIGIYGLIVGAGKPTGPSNPASSSAAENPEPPRKPTSPTRLPLIPKTTDGEAFARSVAAALFTWDTSSEFMPLDYTEVILNVADPTAASWHTIANLPTHSAWAGKSRCR